MNVIDTFVQQYEFNRTRTLALLEQASDVNALMWRPAPGRAHIAWQLAHIGVSEDIFAAERLTPDLAARCHAHWERFRGGSTPDDTTVSVETIRDLLTQGRENLLASLAQFNDDRLNEIVWVRPNNNQEISLLMVLNIIAWHEAHHHGQAHLTLNQFKAASRN